MLSVFIEKQSYVVKNEFSFNIKTYCIHTDTNIIRKHLYKRMIYNITNKCLMTVIKNHFFNAGKIQYILSRNHTNQIITHRDTPLNNKIGNIIFRIIVVNMRLVIAILPPKPNHSCNYYLNCCVCPSIDIEYVLMNHKQITTHFNSCDVEYRCEK